MPEEKKEVKAPEQGKPTNCAKCNKRLKRKTRYYRNNAYYCSKGCWKSVLAKGKEKTTKKEA